MKETTPLSKQAIFWLTRPTPHSERATSTVSELIINVQQQMLIGNPRPSDVAIPRTLVRDLARLDGSGSFLQTEEALRCLGQYLGLESTRPDKEFDTGPDVLWLGDDGIAICMEVKPEKRDTSRYRKQNTGQLHEHVQWVDNNHQISKIIPVFVGPKLPMSDKSSPPPDTIVIELKQFEQIGQKLISALKDASSRALPISLGRELNDLMTERGLLFPDVFHSLDMSPLQAPPPD